MTTWSITASTTNGMPSNGASSCLTNIRFEAQCEGNSTLRKRNSALDACKTSIEWKKDNDLQNEQEGIVYVCTKCGAIIKCAKDKKKGIRITARATKHVKKCTNFSQRNSIAAAKLFMKEDDNVIKEQRCMICAGKGSFRNLIQGNKFSLRKPGAQYKIFIFYFFDQQQICLFQC